MLSENRDNLTSSFPIWTASISFFSPNCRGARQYCVQEKWPDWAPLPCCCPREKLSVEILKKEKERKTAYHNTTITPNKNKTIFKGLCLKMSFSFFQNGIQISHVFLFVNQILFQEKNRREGKAGCHWSP